MAQAIMSQAGTGNANMRMGITYNVGVGYVQITGMYGCRYDSYNTSGSPCTVYTNGGNGINIAAAHNKDIGTFRPNSSKNTTLTSSSYWKSWGAGPKISTSSSSLTLTFTFACSSTANIANSKFSTTITGIPQPYTPVISAVTTSNITRTSVNYSWSVTDYGNGSVSDKYIDLFNNSNCADTAKLQVGYDYTGSFSGLAANTTYYLRANSYNGYYRGYSAVKSFTTTGNAPSISWGGMVAVGRKYAIGSWHVTYDNNAYFGAISANQYGTSTSYGSTATWGWDGSHNAIYYGGDSETNGTLQPNTTYYYKFQQTDTFGRASNTLTGSFTTTGNAPVYNTHYADNITRTSATVEFYGTYDNNSWLSSYYIDWGTSTSYGNKLTNTNALSNLTPNTTYYYKLTATDNWSRTGTATGSFTTLGNAPTVVFREARVGATEATIDFGYNMDTNATLSSYSINYGTSTSYGSTISNKTQLTNLKPKTTYYFKINVTDNWGRTGTYTGSFETFSANATGYIKEYVEGKGIIWRRGTVYIKKERRNMLNTEVITKTINGVTMSYDAVNHAIVLDGTCTTDNTCLNLDKQAPLLLDGDYTISFEELGGTATNKDKVRLQMQNNSTWYGIWVHCNNKAGYETKYLSDTRVNANNIRVDAGVVLDNYTIRFQLEKGTERTKFEPYAPHWKKGRKVRGKSGGQWYGTS